MENAPSPICKVCQGIFQEGHRRRIRLRQTDHLLWESEDPAYNQDTFSDPLGENGQATTDPLNEEVDDDASKIFSDEEDLSEEGDEDTFEWSSEKDEDQRRPSNGEGTDEGSGDSASKRSLDEDEELRKSSDEDLDEMSNEDATEVFSDDEDSRPSEFRTPDHFVYMHYPNLAMLQKSAEYCQSCRVLTHSLRSQNKNFEETLEQSKELEVQRLQELQNSGFRAQLAVLDEDESDPNLDSALQMHFELYHDDRGSWIGVLSISPEKYGQGRLFLTFREKRLDDEFIQDAKLDVFCEPIFESSDSGHLESEASFLASPGEFEAICSQLFVQI